LCKDHTKLSHALLGLGCNNCKWLINIIFKEVIFHKKISQGKKHCDVSGKSLKMASGEVSIKTLPCRFDGELRIFSANVRIFL